MNELMAPQRNKAKKCQLSALVPNQYIHNCTAKTPFCICSSHSQRNGPPEARRKKIQSTSIGEKGNNSNNNIGSIFLVSPHFALPAGVLDENLINVNPFVT